MAMIKYEILLKLRQYLNKKQLDNVINYPTDALIQLLGWYQENDPKKKADR